MLSTTTAAAGTGADDRAATAALTLADVAVERGGAAVLVGVDLELAAGERVGVTGPNGSGKTTLLHLCATLLPLRRGSGQVLGAELGGRVDPGVRRSICLVDHRPALHPQLSVRENLHFFARLYGRSSADVDEALATVGLARAAERRLSHCSHGMSRRADLARVLVVRPRLLLLDEAQSGLDAGSRELVSHLVGDVRDRGGSAVVVSHEADWLRGIVDRLVCVDGGRLVAAKPR